MYRIGNVSERENRDLAEEWKNNDSERRGCSGKIPYRSLQEANEAARELYPGDRFIWGYACNFCFNYHIGHSRQVRPYDTRKRK